MPAAPRFPAANRIVGRPKSDRRTMPAAKLSRSNSPASDPPPASAIASAGNTRPGPSPRKRLKRSGRFARCRRTFKRAGTARSEKGGQNRASGQAGRREAVRFAQKQGWGAAVYGESSRTEWWGSPRGDETSKSHPCRATSGGTRRVEVPKKPLTKVAEPIE